MNDPTPTPAHQPEEQAQAQTQRLPETTVQHKAEISYLFETVARIDQVLDAALQTLLYMSQQDEGLATHLNMIRQNNTRAAAQQRYVMNMRLLRGDSELPNPQAVTPSTDAVTNEELRTWIGLFGALLNDHPELASEVDLTQLNNVPAGEVEDGVYPFIMPDQSRRAMVILRVTGPDSLITLALDGDAVAIQTHWPTNGAWLEHSDLNMVDAGMFRNKALALFNRLCDSLVEQGEEVTGDSVDALEAMVPTEGDTRIPISQFFFVDRDSDKKLRVFAPPHHDPAVMHWIPLIAGELSPGAVAAIAAAAVAGRARNLEHLREMEAQAAAEQAEQAAANQDVLPITDSGQNGQNPTPPENAVEQIDQNAGNNAAATDAPNPPATTVGPGEPDGGAQPAPATPDGGGNNGDGLPASAPPEMPAPSDLPNFGDEPIATEPNADSVAADEAAARDASQGQSDGGGQPADTSSQDSSASQSDTASSSDSSAT